MKCPLCGGKTKPGPDGFFQCVGCHELLRESELVKRATTRTRRNYQKGNRS